MLENKHHILNPPLWLSVQVKKLPITSETFSFTFQLFTQWHKVGFPSLSESASLLFCSKVADYIPKNKLIFLASHPPNMFLHFK